MARTTVITARYNGRCSCGARVAKGDRVRWMGGELKYILACKACALKTMARGNVTINGTTFYVVIKGRDGLAVKASVGVQTAELVGIGAIHIRTDKSYDIGASNASVRMDLAHYVPGAIKAARQLAVDNGIRCKR